MARIRTSRRRFTSIGLTLVAGLTTGILAPRDRFGSIRLLHGLRFVGSGGSAALFQPLLGCGRRECRLSCVHRLSLPIRGREARG